MPTTTRAARPLHFAAFVMNTTGHIIQGTWRRPSARHVGLDGLTAHDERYAWADEYVDVTYKLWEGSWEEDALVQDRATGIHSDLDKVHRINHVGPRYTVEGPHLVSPSPQRTPLLFQAGASEAGRTFAAKNAEAKAAELDGWIKDLVADALADWQATGVDGINLVNAEIPGSYEEFVDHVVPVLQRRGPAQREYSEGTLRQKLFGRGDRLPERHPATRYRGAFAPQHS